MSDHAFIAHPIAVLADVGSGLVVVGTLAGVLPDIAAMGAVAWYSVQLYESRTGQRIIEWFANKFGGDDERRP